MRLWERCSKTFGSTPSTSPAALHGAPLKFLDPMRLAFELTKRVEELMPHPFRSVVASPSSQGLRIVAKQPERIQAAFLDAQIAA